jgi:hypothetical protein
MTASDNIHFDAQSQSSQLGISTFILELGIHSLARPDSANGELQQFPVLFEGHKRPIFLQGSPRFSYLFTRPTSQACSRDAALQVQENSF